MKQGVVRGFVFFIGFVFLVSAQPFLMTLLIASSVLNLLVVLNYFFFFHWVDYIFLMVYLGGLLILVLYFTTFMASFSVSWMKVLFLGGVVLVLSSWFWMQVLEKPVVFVGGESGLFLFSFHFPLRVGLVLLVLLVFVLVFISFLSKLSLPMREV